MSSSKIIKHLLQAYADNDEKEFRRAALQLAAQKSEIGHVRLAEEIREIIAQFPEYQKNQSSLTSVRDFGKPRGELAELMEGGYRKEKLRDIVLSNDARTELTQVINENRKRSTLEEWGVGARRRFLFVGPPGCGKTLAAQVVAGELNMPLLTVRFDGLFSKFLGATAGHLRTIFHEMPKRQGVYFFDEFDALARHRGESLDVGEIKRVVSSFLQLMDSDDSPSIIIAATNYQQSLDEAVVRRFDFVLRFPLPSPSQAKQLIQLKLSSVGLTSSTLESVVRKSKDLSFADIARACDDSVRNMVLHDRKTLSSKDLQKAFASAQKRAQDLSNGD
ncbi:MAG: ATP-binding protein [Bdellovibrionales bacterium]|nr:ATP-binding protein [Bdellovibrionales bacterium]MCB0332284.1 ATP-binding protein [Bdellovibrionales bacterium]